MSLTQFRYFREVVRTGSIRKASERLNVAPSAVSRQIQNLEHDAGLPLFDRHARGMILTSAGQIYARFAQYILLDLDRVRSEVDDLKGLRRGHVRVHTVEGVLADFVMRAIAAFRERHAGVAFRVSITGSEDVAAAVRDGDTDIGLTFNASPDSGIEFLAHFSDALLAVVAPDHPIAGRTQVSLADAVHYAIAIPERSFSIRRMVDQASHVAKVRLDPALVTNSIEALRAFARFGAGVTVLSSLSIQADLRHGMLVGIPFTDDILQAASVDVCVLADRRLPIAVKEFVAEIERTFRSAKEVRAGLKRHGERLLPRP